MNTGLKDKLNNKIHLGNVVHWSDGGDDLALEERIKKRWDRIAVVDLLFYEGKYRPEIVFRVIDSPSKKTRMYKPEFYYGSFIYKDTEHYLTVVAKSEMEYFKKFKNAGECMKYVLEITNENIHN